MTNNETLAVIACEMRTYFQTQKRNGYPEHRPWHQVLSDWADRIEAAYARDIGNVAAMREAIVIIRDMLVNGGHDAQCRAKIVTICNTILSTPPRNCDVGTAQEQHERWKEFCNRNWSSANAAAGLDPCDDCRFVDCDANGSSSGCQFAWAQMPYEEGGAS